MSTKTLPPSTDDDQLAAFGIDVTQPADADALAERFFGPGCVATWPWPTLPDDGFFVVLGGRPRVFLREGLSAEERSEVVTTCLVKGLESMNHEQLAAAVRRAHFTTGMKGASA